MTVEEVQALLSRYDIKERQKRAVVRSMVRGLLTCKELVDSLAKGQLPVVGKIFSFSAAGVVLGN